MMDAYSSIGMPINYNHWPSEEVHPNRAKLQTRPNGLSAYEIVINSDPCIAYLMEENTVTMQALDGSRLLWPQLFL
ncbi:SpoVR family protein [Vibrio lentus]|nr:SpoVR family protein [Vibrio lentus]